MSNGKWIYDGQPLHCSCCGYSPSYSLNKNNSNFCPSCGADMHNITAEELKNKIQEYIIQLQHNVRRARSQCGSFESERKANLTGQWEACQEILEFVERVMHQDEKS